jgi:hypothetical protein
LKTFELDNERKGNSNGKRETRDWQKQEEENSAEWSAKSFFQQIFA